MDLGLDSVYKRNNSWDKAVRNNMHKVPDTNHQNGIRIQMAGQDFKRPNAHKLEAESTESSICNKSKITQKEFLTLQETKKEWMDKNGVKYW